MFPAEGEAVRCPVKELHMNRPLAMSDGVTLPAGSTCMEGHAYPLEPSTDQMRVMVDKAAERVIDHIASLPRQAASYDEHEADAHARAAALAESLPKRGTDLDGLLDLLFPGGGPALLQHGCTGLSRVHPRGWRLPVRGRRLYRERRESIRRGVDCRTGTRGSSS